MGAARTLAERLLRAMLRLAPEASRGWAEAMLRELDFVGRDESHGDWAALYWALGCTGAIFQACLRELAAWFVKRCSEYLGIQSNREGSKVNSTGKNTLGVLAGIGIALALGVVAYLLRNVIADTLLLVGVPRTMWSHILTVMLPTELIVIGAAVVLWRRKRAAVAVGLLVPAVLMAAHVAMFVAHR